MPVVAEATEARAAIAKNSIPSRAPVKGGEALRVKESYGEGLDVMSQ